VAHDSFRKWFFGESKQQVDAGESDLEASSIPAGERDPEEKTIDQLDSSPDSPPPGWYQERGTLRYFDGENWTDHLAPPYPASPTTGGIARAVFLGVLAALFVIWLGAQASPEHVYFPVKFVVKELPNF
jgi:hypothetical protein